MYQISVVCEKSETCQIWMRTTLLARPSSVETVSECVNKSEFKVIKIYWCHRRDTNQSQPCLNPSCQNLRIRRFNKGQLYDLPGLRGTALEAETLQWSCQQKHWCGVFPNNFRPLCQRRHLQNVYNHQVGNFHSMSKVWQQHICRQMKFNCCYHSEILLATTTGRHSAAAGVTADTRSASFSTGIPKWRDLFKSRLYMFDY